MKKLNKPPNRAPRQNWKKQIKVLEGRWKILIIFHLFSGRCSVLQNFAGDNRYLSEDVDSATTRSGKKTAWLRARCPGGAAQVEYKLTKDGICSPSCSEGA